MWPERLVGPANFLFWWNVIFSSIWLFLFSIVLFGVVGVFLKIPILGIILQGFHNRIKESGWVSFFLRHISVWSISQGSILAGSYILANFDLTNNFLPYICLGMILFGVYSGRILQKTTGTKTSFYFGSVRNTSLPNEKDVTPR